MIVYFSGTGNSKYIARLIAEKLNDKAENAAKMIKSEETPEFTSELPYVFVAPTYAWRIPRIFEEWIKKCKFNGSRKAYFILTCGEDIGAAGNYIKKFAEDIDFEYMGTAAVVMPENYLAMFEPAAEEDDDGIVKAAEEYTKKLIEKISENAPLEKVKIAFADYIKSSIVNSSFYSFCVKAKKFYVTDSCISCGKCADNCMLNNITMQNGKPVWHDNCTHCMACICKCPAEAVEYGKNTIGRRRYVCKFSDSL